MSNRLVRCAVGAASVVLSSPWADADLLPMGSSEYKFLPQGSAYALGSYVVNVIFLEDATHTWTTSSLNARKASVTNSLAWWTQQSQSLHPAARLRFTTNYLNNGNPVSVAAIGGAGDESAYDNALAALGYSYGTTGSTMATRKFNDAMRIAHQTNWATTLYIKPINGGATAHINGPLINLSHSNSTAIFQHELGHIFGALDEYASGGTAGEQGGYLFTYNWNAEKIAGGATNPAKETSNSLMNNNTAYISQSTRDLIGWRDLDADTIPDILDTLPTLTAETTEDGAQGRFSADLSAAVTALPSPNLSFYGPLTIKTLSSAQWRLDQGDWNAMSTLDGAWDGYTETLRLTLDGLSAGAHQVDVRVTDAVGNSTDLAMNFTTIPEPAGAVLLLAGLTLSMRRSRR